MKDIQGQRDHRRIGIKKVGVKNISYPIVVLDRAKQRQRTVATVNMYVNLPHHFKGTHMSRFVEILNRCRGEINLENMHRILVEMKERLDAEAAHLEIEFPYFMRGEDDPPDTPQGERLQGIGIGEYRCRMHGSLAAQDKLFLTINTPIAPPRATPGCSGLPRSLGHWGNAEISLRCLRFIWIEEIIELVARVTRHHLRGPDGGENPEADCDLSVENMARALGAELKRHPEVHDFTVRVENLAAGYSTFAVLNEPGPKLSAE
ncbi:MAG: GTP cyclohydrolase, FolE2/MptA family [Desulfurivibrio sp.]|nr:GTP cyclohydrolase, FolE2/MptA family [Desulfurivibrio sp.]